MMRETSFGFQSRLVSEGLQKQVPQIESRIAELEDVKEQKLRNALGAWERVHEIDPVNPMADVIVLPRYEGGFNLALLPPHFGLLYLCQTLSGKRRNSRG